MAFCERYTGGVVAHGRVWRAKKPREKPGSKPGSPGSPGSPEDPTPWIKPSEVLQILPPHAEEEGCISEVFAYLWSKHPSTHEGVRQVLLPETVVFKFRQPASWFFLSAEGQLRKKRGANITNANIFAAFSKIDPTLQKGPKLGANHRDICAVYTYTRIGDPGNHSDSPPVQEDADAAPRPGQKRVTCVEQFTVPELHHFLFEREKVHNGILQRYVKPTGDRESFAVVGPTVGMRRAQHAPATEPAARPSDGACSSAPDHAWLPRATPPPTHPPTHPPTDVQGIIC